MAEYLNTFSQTVTCKRWQHDFSCSLFQVPLAWQQWLWRHWLDHLFVYLRDYYLFALEYACLSLGCSCVCLKFFRRNSSTDHISDVNSENPTIQVYGLVPISWFNTRIWHCLSGVLDIPHTTYTTQDMTRTTRDWISQQEDQNIVLFMYCTNVKDLLLLGNGVLHCLHRF